MSIDETIRDIVLGKEGNISEKYDKRRKEQMDRIYNGKQELAILPYAFMCGYFVGK